MVAVSTLAIPVKIVNHWYEKVGRFFSSSPCTLPTKCPLIDLMFLLSLLVCFNSMCVGIWTGKVVHMNFYEII